MKITDKHGIVIETGDIVRYDNGRSFIADMPRHAFWMRIRKDWRHNGGGLIVLQKHLVGESNL